MKRVALEFAWVLLNVLFLTLLPWWLTVFCAAALAPVLLKLTERGFRRRLTLLFVTLTLLFFSLHAIKPEVSVAIARLMKLPHTAILALLSAGGFSVLLALAGESALWIKYSLKHAGIELSKSKTQSTSSMDERLQK